MRVKHIHPKYENESQRKDALQDAHRACLTAVSVLRRNTAKKRDA